jgi:glutamine synthetase
VFNGNNYSEDWAREAAARGLSNLQTTADAIPRLASAKNVALFTKMGIFSEAEVRSRCEIMLENYCKVLRIEANTMLDMARRDILPTLAAYATLRKGQADLLAIPAMEKDSEKLRGMVGDLYGCIEALDGAVKTATAIADTRERALYYKESVLCAMENMRKVADGAETVVPSADWPFPTYANLLFGI